MNNDLMRLQQIENAINLNYQLDSRLATGNSELQTLFYLQRVALKKEKKEIENKLAWAVLEEIQYSF